MWDWIEIVSKESKVIWFYLKKKEEKSYSPQNLVKSVSHFVLRKGEGETKSSAPLGLVFLSAKWCSSSFCANDEGRRVKSRRGGEKRILSFIFFFQFDFVCCRQEWGLSIAPHRHLSGTNTRVPSCVIVRDQELPNHVVNRISLCRLAHSDRENTYAHLQCIPNVKCSNSLTSPVRLCSLGFLQYFSILSTPSSIN